MKDEELCREGESERSGEGKRRAGDQTIDVKGMYRRRM
jgi:hypothetical protein